MPEALGAVLIASDLAAEIGAPIGLSGAAIQTAVGAGALLAAPVGLSYALKPSVDADRDFI